MNLSKKHLIMLGIAIILVIITAITVISIKNDSTNEDNQSNIVIDKNKFDKKVISRTQQLVSALNLLLINGDNGQLERTNLTTRYIDNISSEFTGELLEYYDEELERNYIPFYRSLDFLEYNFASNESITIMSFTDEHIIYKSVYVYDHLFDEDKIAKAYYTYKFNEDGYLVDYDIKINELERSVLYD